MRRGSSQTDRIEKYLQQGRVEEAVRVAEAATQRNDRDAAAWVLLAKVYQRAGNYQEVLQAAKRALAIESRNAAALLAMARALRSLGQPGQAVACYQQVLRLSPESSEARLGLGEVCQQQGSFDAAERAYQAAVAADPASVDARYRLAGMLELQGRVEEADACYDQVLEAEPAHGAARWKKARLLPVIYDDVGQIDAWREEYARRLYHLAEGLELDSAEGRAAARHGLASGTNFYLQYQGRDDKELQILYGGLVHRVMSASYPRWSVPLDMPPVNPGERIRIGYASTFLRNHNGAVWLLGWLRHRNSADFEVFCYHMGSRTDDKTDEFRQLCDHFHHIPADIEKAAAQIRTDNLHILVYPELGMDPHNIMMAGLRLAPVQCVGWGHPITSGLPTMDYWLSSDLMEPENGQEHYTERLVRLPNMANCYSREQHDRLQAAPPTKSRSDFGLPEDAILYFCSQSLFKYLPQYDHLWPEIAKQVPAAKFVFLAISSVHVVKRFMARVERAFDRAGLRAADHCIMLNRQSPEDYLVLNQLMDVFLDNPPWSGNNTGLAAIDACLPIVTLPTHFMRGRHSHAILRMLGVMDTVAHDEEEYVDIAARLGMDSDWRDEIRARIAGQCERIYEDTDCIKGLEAFYSEVVKSGGSTEAF